MADARRITVDDLRRRMQQGEEFVFIDTRNPQAWAESDIKLPKALRVPLDNIEKTFPKLPKNKPIVTYCT